LQLTASHLSINAVGYTSAHNNNWYRASRVYSIVCGITNLCTGRQTAGFFLSISSVAPVIRALCLISQLNGLSMFYQGEDEKHTDQIQELMSCLGKFIVEFERICAEIGHLIIFIFEREGLKNQSLAQVVIGNKAAADLRLLFGALYSELNDQDEDDRKSVHNLLNRFDKLSSVRNNLIHVYWSFGNQSGEQELDAITTKFKTKQKIGSQYIEKKVTASLINQYAFEARKQLVLFRRLGICLFQGNHKTSEYMFPYGDDCDIDPNLFEKR
jgi:hypothetical protein